MARRDSLAFRLADKPHCAVSTRGSLFLRLRLDNMQRVALRLGILGAFVGLVLALKDLQELAGGPDSLAHMDRFLPGFLGALYLKFGASIGGLGASLYGFALTSFAEKKQAVYFRNMEAATASLLDLAAKSLKFSAFVDEFGHIRSSIKDLQNEVHDQTRKTSALAENVGQLAQLGSNIGQFTSSLGGRAQQIPVGHAKALRSRLDGACI